mmetsp:Transcript_45551/g.72862  ORF Transcript_45551/g.72862 Transcript_45551/m.72862 type:complete len:201 (+) Transcript_45551:186-788(+)
MHTHHRISPQSQSQSNRSCIGLRLDFLRSQFMDKYLWFLLFRLKMLDPFAPIIRDSIGKQLAIITKVDIGDWQLHRFKLLEFRFLILVPKIHSAISSRTRKRAKLVMKSQRIHSVHILFPAVTLKREIGGILLRALLYIMNRTSSFHGADRKSFPIWKHSNASQLVLQQSDHLLDRLGCVAYIEHHHFLVGQRYAQNRVL